MIIIRDLVLVLAVDMTYHDACVFDVRRAGADFAMVLRLKQRLFIVFALVFLDFACAWDFGGCVGVYVLFLLRCGELLRVGYAISDRHVARWACVGELRLAVRKLVLKQ